MIQYSLLGRTATSTRLNTTFRGLVPSPSSDKTANQFCLRMGTELVPETLYSNELTRLCAREDYIEHCDFNLFLIVGMCSELMGSFGVCVDTHKYRTG
jgi:hypothetical protein